MLCCHYKPTRLLYQSTALGKRRCLHNYRRKNNKYSIALQMSHIRNISFDQAAVDNLPPVIPRHSVVQDLGMIDGMEDLLDPVLPEPFVNVVNTLPDLLSNPLPTNVICHLIDNFQVSTGLPWWAAIAGTAIGLKCLLYPVHIWMRKDLQSFVKTVPLQLHTFLSTYYQNVISLGSKRALALAFETKTNFCKESNLSEYPAIVPLSILSTVSLSLIISIIHLANLTYAPLIDGGILWFPNLSMADSYMLLPLMNAALFIAVCINHPNGFLIPVPVTSVGFKYQVPLFCVALPQLWLPSGLLCYFIASNSIGLIIQLFLKVEAVRKVHGLVKKEEVFQVAIQNPSLLLDVGQCVLQARSQLKEIESGDSINMLDKGVQKLEGSIGAEPKEDGVVPPIQDWDKIVRY